jgi:hypothetical protein
MEKRQKLASQIKVNEPTLKDLVDDVGVIVSVWLLAPTTQDAYSARQHQAFVNASVDFLERVHRLSRKGMDRPESEEALAIDGLTEPSLTRMRQDLSPLMKLINPAWQDSASWDVRAALEMALSLSDKLPQGEDAAGDYRDRLAADSLVESWRRLTKSRPSAGENRMNSPYRFYLGLLGEGSPGSPSLSVKPPQGLFPHDKGPFSSEEIQDFREVILEKRALRRAIQRWLKAPENRQKAT